MKIKDFLESEIRSNILIKVKPQKINKKSPHWKGSIYSENILVAKVKIPNYHKRIMHQSKSKYIARDLHLTEEEFNGLIECPFKSNDFYKKMSKIKK